jgi:hypothetical protein
MGDRLGLIDRRGARAPVHVLQPDDVGRDAGNHLGDLDDVIRTAGGRLSLNQLGLKFDSEWRDEHRG